MTDTLAAAYRHWADVEARGVSPVYEDWARGIAEHPATLRLIASLPHGKRQPNLVFGAARFVGAPVGSSRDVISWLAEHWHRVDPVIVSRSTQTNEAGRCAVLLPVLSRMDGPLALIEVGASAGLCLFPDRYSYRYAADGAETTIDPAEGPSPVVLPCSIDAPSVPSRLPEVVWRAGVDLNPIDVTDADQMNWLETLVWPEHHDRRQRLRAAAALAAGDPPHVVPGDLIERLPDLIDQAPDGARVVVFHSAVLVYLTPERREEFARLVRSFPNVTWVSNEGAGVLPEVTARVREPIGGRTILAVDQKPVALVAPHGQSYQAVSAA
ncbi:DUF2332 domain-containing protein [Microbacterium amylolyticum]|uniref:DUF2332 domain-containing protein n=1 Tax=Microbacterium amylolyticum TaxID=936337 RepID=A0ABS4ZJA8_9MICO|nr:DUF2332 domain-containing protein [Microbacterium amylolyticum]MBP2437040.1 hypothetical protein [Microbacterium amylolyticum]